MKTRTLAWILGGALVALLLTAGAGVALAQASGGLHLFGPNTAQRTATADANSSSYGYGPGRMMGDGYGPMHDDMIENGYGMGYGPSQDTAGPPVVGATQVTMQNDAFQPMVIEVTKGTTVTWTNNDSVPHTITFRNGTQGSGTLQQGDTFTYTFNDVGVYQYYCSVHPDMVGKVIVVA